MQLKAEIYNKKKNCNDKFYIQANRWLIFLKPNAPFITFDNNIW